MDSFHERYIPTAKLWATRLSGENGSHLFFGEHYFQASSPQTLQRFIEGKQSFRGINEEFISNEYANAIRFHQDNRSSSFLSSFLYASFQSPVGGQMDFKNNSFGGKSDIRRDQLHLGANGMLYNLNEAGNYIWGSAMAFEGFSESATILSADLGTLGSSTINFLSDVGHNSVMFLNALAPVFAPETSSPAIPFRRVDAPRLDASNALKAIRAGHRQFGGRLIGPRE